MERERERERERDRERDRERESELEIGSHKNRMQTDSLDKSSIREQVSTGLEFVL